MTYKAAWLFDQGRPCGTEANIAKLTAAQAAWEAADQAFQTLGGMAYSKEYPVERLFRDARIGKNIPVVRADGAGAHRHLDAGPAQDLLTKPTHRRRTAHDRRTHRAPGDRGADQGAEHRARLRRHRRGAGRQPRVLRQDRHRGPRLAHAVLARAARAGPRDRRRLRRARRAARRPGRDHGLQPPRARARRHRRRCTPARPRCRSTTRSRRSQVAYVAEHSAPSVVVLETADHVDRWSEALATGAIQHSSSSTPTTSPRARSRWDELVALGRSKRERARRRGRAALAGHRPRPPGDDPLHLGHDRATPRAW